MAHSVAITQSCLQCRWQRLAAPQTKLQTVTPAMQRQQARLRQLSHSAATPRDADNLQHSQPAPDERSVEKTHAHSADEVMGEAESEKHELGVR